MIAVHFRTEPLSLGVPMVLCVICRPLGNQGCEPHPRGNILPAVAMCLASLLFFSIHSVAVSLCVCGTRSNLSAGAVTDAGGCVFTPLRRATNTYLGSVEASCCSNCFVSAAAWSREQELGVCVCITKGYHVQLTNCMLGTRAFEARLCTVFICPDSVMIGWLYDIEVQDEQDVVLTGVALGETWLLQFVGL